MKRKSHKGWVGHEYSAKSVDKAIASSNRSGKRIGGKEAKLIHGLLKGWRGK